MGQALFGQVQNLSINFIYDKDESSIFAPIDWKDCKGYHGWRDIYEHEPCRLGSFPKRGSYENLFITVTALTLSVNAYASARPVEQSQTVLAAAHISSFFPDLERETDGLPLFTGQYLIKGLSSTPETPPSISSWPYKVIQRSSPR